MWYIIDRWSFFRICVINTWIYCLGAKWSKVRSNPAWLFTQLQYNVWISLCIVCHCYKHLNDHLWSMRANNNFTVIIIFFRFDSKHFSHKTKIWLHLIGWSFKIRNKWYIYKSNFLWLELVLFYSYWIFIKGNVFIFYCFIIYVL